MAGVSTMRRRGEKSPKPSEKKGSKKVLSLAREISGVGVAIGGRSIGNGESSFAGKKRKKKKEKPQLPSISSRGKCPSTVNKETVRIKAPPVCKHAGLIGLGK